MTEWHPLEGSDWFSHLEQEFGTPRWAELQDFLECERSQHNVYPPCHEIYAALELTTREDTKVVILGQDPYARPHQAHGLSFSVRRGIGKPGSLQNIHRELHADLGYPCPDHGSLKAWAQRGVLLLNTTLTVRAGEPGSHVGRAWTGFTDAVIKAVSGKTDHVVFLLWGRKAQAKKRLIDPRHTVIESSHPSPKSARVNAPLPFLGSRPFSQANRALGLAGRGEVDWELSD